MKSCGTYRCSHNEPQFFLKVRIVFSEPTFVEDLRKECSRKSSYEKRFREEFPVEPVALLSPSIPANLFLMAGSQGDSSKHRHHTRLLWSLLTDGHWSQSPRFAHFNEAKSVLRGVTTSPSYVVFTGKCQAKLLWRALKGRLSKVSA